MHNVPRPRFTSVEVIGSDGHVRSLRDIEADILLAALLRHNGRVSAVARELHIDRSSVYRKIRRSKIDAQSFRKGPPA